MRDFTRRVASGLIAATAADPPLTMAGHADATPAALTPPQKIARNLALVRTFYDGYRLGHVRGYNDNWRLADFAPDFVLAGGLNHHRPIPSPFTVDYGERTTRQLH